MCVLYPNPHRCRDRRQALWIPLLTPYSVNQFCSWIARQTKALFWSLLGIAIWNTEIWVEICVLKGKKKNRVYKDRKRGTSSGVTQVILKELWQVLANRLKLCYTWWISYAYYQVKNVFGNTEFSDVEPIPETVWGCSHLV